jgi:Kef-type K+ transport system membrane component KefB
LTHFVDEIKLVFLLFFLGLEFTLGRVVRRRQHAFIGSLMHSLRSFPVFIRGAGFGGRFRSRSSMRRRLAAAMVKIGSPIVRST